MVATLLAQQLSTAELVAGTCGAYKTSCEQQGFSPMAAELMAVYLHTKLVGCLFPA